jgi:hypothetical protein
MACLMNPPSQHLEAFSMKASNQLWCHGICSRINLGQSYCLRLLDNRITHLYFHFPGCDDNIFITAELGVRPSYNLVYTYTFLACRTKNEGHLMALTIMPNENTFVLGLIILIKSLSLKFNELFCFYLRPANDLPRFLSRDLGLQISGSLTAASQNILNRVC